MNRDEFSVWASKVTDDLDDGVPKSKFSTESGLMKQWDDIPKSKKWLKDYKMESAIYFTQSLPNPKGGGSRKKILRWRSDYA